MALKDFMAKKPTKKQEEDQAKTAEFLKELDIIQQKYDIAIATCIEITENGIIPRFKLVPYPKKDGQG